MVARQRLAELDIRIGVDTDLARELDRIELTVKRKSKGIKRALGAIGAGFAAASAAAAGLGLVVRNGLRAADALQDNADAAAVAVERYQSLRFAAEQAGVTTTQFDDGMRRLNRRLGLFAQTGGGPAASALDRLGISVRNARGEVRATEDIFDDIIAALGRFTSRAEVAAVASELFGDDAGPKLALLVGQGTAAIAELEQKARDLGIVMDGELVAKAADAADKFTALERLLKTKVTAAVVENAEALDELAEALIELIPVVARGTTEFLKFWGIIDRSPLGRLDREIAQIENRLKGLRELEGVFGGDSGEIARLEKLLARLKSERAALAAEGPVRFGPEARRLISEGGGEDDTDAGQDEERFGFGITPRAAAGPREAFEAAEEARASIRRLEDELLSIRGESEALIRRRAEREIEIITEKFEANRLTEEQFLRKRELINEITTEKIKRLYESEGDSLRDVFESFSRDAAQELTDLALAGELSAKRIGQAFKRLALNNLFNRLAKPAERFIDMGLDKLFGGGKAGGGSVSPGRMFDVGERGLETIVGRGVFIPTMPSTVRNNADTRRALSGGGGPAVTVNVTNRFDVGLESVDTRIAQATGVMGQTVQRQVLDLLTNPGIGRV